MWRIGGAPEWELVGATIACRGGAREMFSW